MLVRFNELQPGQFFFTKWGIYLWERINNFDNVKSTIAKKVPAGHVVLVVCCRHDVLSPYDGRRYVVVDCLSKDVDGNDFMLSIVNDTGNEQHVLNWATSQ